MSKKKSDRGDKSFILYDLDKAYVDFYGKDDGKGNLVGFDGKTEAKIVALKAEMKTKGDEIKKVKAEIKELGQKIEACKNFKTIPGYTSAFYATKPADLDDEIINCQKEIKAKKRFLGDKNKELIGLKDQLKKSRAGLEDQLESIFVKKPEMRRVADLKLAEKYDQSIAKYEKESDILKQKRDLMGAIQDGLKGSPIENVFWKQAVEAINAYKQIEKINEQIEQIKNDVTKDSATKRKEIESINNKDKRAQIDIQKSFIDIVKGISKDNDLNIKDSDIREIIKDLASNVKIQGNKVVNKGKVLSTLSKEYNTEIKDKKDLIDKNVKAYNAACERSNVEPEEKKSKTIQNGKSEGSSLEEAKVKVADLDKKKSELEQKISDALKATSLTLDEVTDIEKKINEKAKLYSKTSEEFLKTILDNSDKNKTKLNNDNETIRKNFEEALKTKTIDEILKEEEQKLKDAEDKVNKCQNKLPAKKTKGIGFIGNLFKRFGMKKKEAEYTSATSERDTAKNRVDSLKEYINNEKSLSKIESDINTLNKTNSIIQLLNEQRITNDEYQKASEELTNAEGGTPKNPQKKAEKIKLSEDQIKRAEKSVAMEQYMKTQAIKDGIDKDDDER